MLASKGHVAVCGALARKSMAAWDEGADLTGKFADKAGDDGAAAAAAAARGPPLALVDMWVAGARLLGALAMEDSAASDSARDELMTCNAHKIVLKAMHPDHELRQAAGPLAACLEALRHLAGSGERSTLLLRREIVARDGDVVVAAAMRAHPNDLGVQVR